MADNNLGKMVIFLVGIVLAAVLLPVAYDFIVELDAVESNVPSWVVALFTAFVGIGFVLYLIEMVMPGTIIKSRRR